MTQAAMAHLLVVEDEALVRDQLCMLLSQEGHEHPGNGRKGMAVLRGLRTQTQAAVIILTGYGSDDVEAIARRLGVKPVLKRGSFCMNSSLPSTR